jgi:hypothetical protein
MSCSGAPPSEEALKFHGLGQQTDYAGMAAASKVLFEKGDIEGAKAKLDSAISGSPSLEKDAEISRLSGVLDSISDLRKKDKVAKLMRKIRKETDEMTGITQYEDITSPKYVNRNGFYLRIVEDNKGGASMFLKIQYYADDWLFIQKYMVKADEEVFEIVPIKMSTDNGDGMIWESCTITVNEDIYSNLLKIAQAKSTKIRFSGRQYYKDKVIPAAEIKALNNMLELYSAMGLKPPKY